MSTPLPITFAMAAIPAGNYTITQLGALFASRLTASSGESFAIFVTSTTEPTSNVGKWFDPVNMVWKAWDDDAGAYAEIQYSASRIKAGNLGILGAINRSVRGQLFHPDYTSVLFNASEVGLQTTDPYTTGTGTAFSFTKCIPVRMVGPGHADAGGGVYPILCPNADGFATILFNVRIINDTPDVNDLCFFIELNESGTYTALQAISSNDAGNQLGTGFRAFAFAVTDSVRFFVAPCDGNGDIPVSVACRVEIDVMAING